MKKYFFSWLLIGLSVNIYAHQPDISTTILSQQDNNQWVLQVKAAMTAFKYEVTTNFPQAIYTSPEEFQELVIRHLMENITIVFDGTKEVKLQKGMVKLGHETNAIFVVTGVPDIFRTIQFRNSSFKDINKNQSALVILKEGYAKKQFVLNNSNNHTESLKVQDKELVSMDANIKSAMLQPNLLIGYAFLGVVGLFWFFKSKSRRELI